jgi:putative drug exporter of the RND superfamily
MTPVLYALGKACSRHGWIVVGIWAVLFAGFVAVDRSIGDNLSDDLTLPGTDSQSATDVLEDKFPSRANGTVPIVFVAPDGGKVSDSKYEDAITSVYTSYTKDPDVASAVSPFSDAGSSQISKDASTAYINLTLKESASDLSIAEAQDLLDLATPAESTGLQVSAGGYVGSKLSKPSSHLSEVIGLAAAVVILLLTFGTLVAMAMPIVSAIAGLGIGLSAIAIIGAFTEVPTTAPALATMIGLGVGIDYGLFVVTQHRSQLATGMDPLESAARATATAGGAVVFAGGTVIIALLSLLVAGIPIVTSLGYTSAIVVALAMLAAITLLPAMLGLLGHRINSGRVTGRTGAPDSHAGGWHRWAELVSRHPWTSIVAALVILLVLAIPVLSLELGQTDDAAAAPGTETRESYDAMTAGFGAGLNGPLLIAVDLSKPATSASDPRLQSLHDAIAKTTDVGSVSAASVNDAGTAAVYRVISKSAPSSDATVTLVDTLRDSVLPAATKGQDMTAYVGGSTASYIDLADQITQQLPQVIALVLLLSFVLLAIAFRSLLVPLKAVILNVLSICAAFGVVSFVFTHDATAELVGLDGAVPIVSYVPLMMFAILFGLSMDYEVFLMSHVREEYLETHDARRAVVEGLAGTARVITSAALIMVSVFCAFILNGDPNIKQFGVGMAAAVLIDATVVRCLLVPGVMRVLGDAAWWYPRWLDRVTPHFSIEGKEWFAERDAAAASEAPEPAPALRAD